MSTQQLPILLDCDGVLCQFDQLIIDRVNNCFGTSFKVEDITDNIRLTLSEYWDDYCEPFLCKEGFAQLLKPYPGVVEEVKKLQEIRPVKIVTSPYIHNSTWVFDRLIWLQRYFDIGYKDVIFARDKRFVNGICLVDDNFDNIKEWNEQNCKPAFLWSQPWNSDAPFINKQIQRTNDWNYIREFAKFKMG